MATVEELQGRIAELEERLALFESKTGFMSADTMLENARAWIERNPRAWEIIQNQARAAIRDNTRFSVKKAIEVLRDNPIITWLDDSDFKISNSYASVFTRILVQEMPQLRDHVTLKRSKVDRLFK